MYFQHYTIQRQMTGRGPLKVPNSDIFNVKNYLNLSENISLKEQFFDSFNSRTLYVSKLCLYLAARPQLYLVIIDSRVHIHSNEVFSKILNTEGSAWIIFPRIHKKTIPGQLLMFWVRYGPNKAPGSKKRPCCPTSLKDIGT